MKKAFDFAAWQSLPTSALLNEAWQVRRQNHDSSVVFASPGAKHYENEYHLNARERFVTISVTGTACSLSCQHCGKKLLETMVKCETPEALARAARDLRAAGCQGVLISGGADETGAVPLAPFLEAIKNLKAMGLKVLVHTGLAKEETLAGLKEAGVDQVLVDIIGAEETIRDVYHLDCRPEDYHEFLRLCQKYRLDVAPHIVIGLHFGQLVGELEALKMISAVKPARIVLVVLNPLKGTGMEAVPPPAAEECGRLIALARIANPTAFISLGCARPAGVRAGLIEQYALNAGVNAIAYPSPDTISLAEEMELNISFSDLCCTLAAEQLMAAGGSEG